MHTFVKRTLQKKCIYSFNRYCVHLLCKCLKKTCIFLANFLAKKCNASLSDSISFPV
eukprot:UN22154